MPGVNPQEVAKRYNSLEIIIDEDDNWHLYTKKSISKFIHSSLKILPKFSKLNILNAGSAGFSYGLDEKNILHVDVADKHLSKLPNSVVASIEDLPLPDKNFDLIICVGSVLNYCDPILVMNQFSRVLKDNGYLILEFECSRTFELLFKKEFNNSAAFIETFFDAYGDKESIWYFSENFIDNLTSSYKFEVIRKKRFHFISPLIYRITKNATFSASFAKLEGMCALIPGINKFCSNSIYFLKKGSC